MTSSVDDLLYAPISEPEKPDEFTDVLNDVAQQYQTQLQQLNQILQGQQAQAQNSNPFTGPYNQQHYQGILGNQQGGLGNLGNGGLSNQGGIGSGPLPTSSRSDLAQPSSQPLNKLFWEALPPGVKQARYLEIAKLQYEKQRNASRLPRCLRPGISFETAMAKIEAMLTGPHNTIE